MKACRFLVIVAILALQPASGQNVPKLPCANEDKKCAYETMKNHLAGKIDAWSTMAALPVGERIGPAPPYLVEYINLDNILNGYSERPRVAKVDTDLLADVNAAIADLPPEIWRLFGERLLGIYFVENLGGTGYTDYVLDQNSKPVAAYVVLDAAILARTKANAWVTWKENTPFNPGASHQLAARIEADGDDNRKNAIQYILLHELGHVLSVGTRIHPPWNIEPRDVAEGATFPYSDLSWQIDRKANSYRSLFDANFPQRPSTVYYAGAKLSAAEMVPTYINLQNTNFPSLYAATSPGDDFAESFASYVHVVLMHRPWQIRISSGGKVVKVFESCWGELRCARKQEILKGLVERSASAIGTH